MLSFSVAVLFHDLLEPGSGAKMAPPPLPPGLNNSNNTTPSHRADFMSEWADVERILLQSTFDEVRPQPLDWPLQYSIADYLDTYQTKHMVFQYPWLVLDIQWIPKWGHIWDQ